MGLIYTYADPRTGEIRYVGKTERDLESRIREHQCRARSGRTHLYCWTRSLEAKPLVEVLEETQNTTSAEVYWIAQLKAWGFNLVNHTDGGEGQRGLRHTQATKEKIGRAQRGLKKPWAAENIKAAQSANLGSTRPGSRETIKKAVLAARSESARIARSRAQGGRPVWCEQNGIVYPTASLAAEALGLDPSSVLKAVKGRLKSTGGFTFRFTKT
jgi:hypothetical protein